MCVLGGILKKGVMDDTLERAYFTEAVTLSIWDAMVRTYEDNGAVDLMSVRHACMQRTDRHILKSLSEAIRVFEEAQYPAISLKHVRFRHFVRTVRTEMTHANSKLKLLEGTLSERQLMSWVTEFVDKISEQATNVFDMSTFMPQLPLGEHGETNPEKVVDESLARNQSKEMIEANYSGYPELAKNSDMGESIWTVAAPTGLGKTSFVLYEAYNLAKNGRPTLYFSTEMSQEQVIKRLIGIDEPLVPMSQLFQKCLEDRYENDARFSIRRMKNYPFFFMNGLTSVKNMAAAAQRLHQFLQNGARTVLGDTIIVNDPRLHTVYIDYIQQTDLSYYSDHLPQAFELAMKDVRVLSNRIKGRVVVVSQMNRDIFKRQNKIPTLADLKEASALEQASNVVAFLHRDDYYLQPDWKEEFSQYQKEEQVDDKSYLIVQKNRNNKNFKMPLKFLPHRACYVPLTGDMDYLIGKEYDDLITSGLDVFGEELL